MSLLLLLPLPVVMRDADATLLSSFIIVALLLSLLFDLCISRVNNSRRHGQWSMVMVFFTLRWESDTSPVIDTDKVIRYVTVTLHSALKTLHLPFSLSVIRWSLVITSIIIDSRSSLHFSHFTNINS